MRHCIGVVSLGCAKNLVDTEVMLGILSKEGYKLVAKEEEADILLVNTCGFIESAKQESINTILKLAQYKEIGNCKALIVAGCLAERYNQELMEEIPEIDGILGTGNFSEILQVINQVLKGEKYLTFGNQNYQFTEDLPRVLSTAPYTAYLKIADGCDHFCTYCIIPYLRGSYRSRKMEAIIQEAEMLANQGVKEIIIIAQDITEYGKDIYGSHKLLDLLKKLVIIEDIQWIRLLYAYPEHISDDLIMFIRENDKICNYLDIPIQHINNPILKRMGRNIKKEQIIELIEKMRKYITNIIIRTSIIVGFPGENQEDFNELLDFIEEIKIDHVGVFTYSREEDTPASKLPNQIDEEIKVARKNKLMEMQQRISLHHNRKNINQIFTTLIEGQADDQTYYGRSYAHAPDIDGLIYVKSKSPLQMGGFYNVRIKKAYEYDMLGEILNESGK